MQIICCLVRTVTRLDPQSISNAWRNFFDWLSPDLHRVRTLNISGRPLAQPDLTKSYIQWPKLTNHVCLTYFTCAFQKNQRGNVVETIQPHSPNKFQGGMSYKTGDKVCGYWPLDLANHLVSTTSSPLIVLG